MTAKLVDEITDSHSQMSRESWGQGVANLCTGFYGGIAGCAMIGQTIVNVELGQARTRISTLSAGLALLLLVTSLSHIMAKIPMVVLAGIMMIVALKIINWHSIRPSTLKRMPLSETLVMVTTIGITVWTSNLAIGIVSGVLLAIALFARRAANVIRAVRTIGDDGQQVRDEIHGPLFFGSSNEIVERFCYAEDPPHVTIDLTHSQILDVSSIAALDAIQTKYHNKGITVTRVGFDQRSGEFHGRFTGKI